MPRARAAPGCITSSPVSASCWPPGGLAISARQDGRERWLSVPFGIGSALTLDEISLLAGRDNPYWGSERLALAQGALALAATVALSGRFIAHGRRTPGPDVVPAAMGPVLVQDPGVTDGAESRSVEGAP